MSLEKHVPEHQAALMIGERVVEMVDRLSAVDSVVPGIEAEWFFKMDDRKFRLAVVSVSDES